MQVLQHVATLAKERGLDPAYVTKIFQQIMAECLKKELAVIKAK